MLTRLSKTVLILILSIAFSAALAGNVRSEEGAGVRAYGSVMKSLRAWDALLRKESGSPEFFSRVNAFRASRGLPVILYPNAEAGPVRPESLPRVEIDGTCGTEYVIFMKSLSEEDPTLELANPDTIFEVDRDGDVITEWLVPAKTVISGIREDTLIIDTNLRTYDDLFGAPGGEVLIIPARLEVTARGAMTVTRRGGKLPAPEKAKCPDGGLLPEFAQMECKAFKDRPSGARRVIVYQRPCL